MILPFEHALRVWRNHFGEDSAASIQRTEIRADGSIVFTTSTAEGPRCFRLIGDVLEQLSFKDDSSLRLAPAIAGRLDLNTAQLLSWRPGRRLVARVQDESGVTIVKGWRKGRAPAAVDLHERARIALRGDLVVPPVRWTDPRADAVGFELCSGDGLMLDRADLCRRIGAGIATLQQRMDSGGLARHGRIEEIENLRRMAERHARVGAPHATDVLAATDEISAHAGDGPDPSVAAHRDLHDGQFSVAESSITVFDFDMAALAEPELDVANLCAHAAWCGQQIVRGIDSSTSAASERAIIAGYQRPLDERAFSFYRATTLLRLALVWGARPRWRTLSSELVRMARRSMLEVSRA